MKILSIRQPWAWMIIHLGKDIENRNWSTKVRGRVLVHASSHRPTCNELLLDARETALAALGDRYLDVMGRAAEATGLKGWDDFYRDVPRGGIIGSVDIVDCVQRSDSPWFFGSFGFVLRNPKPLPFIPLKAQLGFFDATPDLMARITEAAA